MPRSARAVAALLLAALACPSVAAANQPSAAAIDRQADAPVTVPRSVARARAALRAELGTEGVVSVDERSGAARVIARLDGYLTGPSERSAPQIALGWVRAHAAALGLDDHDIDGLRQARRWRTADGYEHVAWEQTVAGIPFVDGGLRADLTASGRLVALTGPVVPGLTAPVTAPRIDAGAAAAALRRSAGATGAAPPLDSGLVAYRAGTAQRLGWRLILPVSSTAIYDGVVDAVTGAVVRRVNRVDFASGLAFRNYPGAAAGGVQSTFDLAPYLPAGATTLAGPYAHAFSDTDDRVPFLNGEVNLAPRPQDEASPSAGGDFNHLFHSVPDGGGRCTGAGCAWDHATPGSWSLNRAQDITQVFFYVNTFHDHLEQSPIGFDAASGNFEGADAILAQSMDGANTAAGLPDDRHVNNANMATLPDGTPGLMQMYLFGPPDEGAFSGGDDASVVYHEYTHGLSNRLVTDAQGRGALGAAQPGAMGEGWSDYYALDYLEEQGLRTDTATAGEIRIGGYLDGDGTSLRTEPIDCAPGSPANRCPGTVGAGSGGYTYGDFGRLKGVPEVHDDGEIWAQTLWSIRQALIAAHGRVAGIERARRYITTGMRLSPPYPSMLDERNAILEASSDDDAVLWSVFAQRGMGYFAGSDGPDDTRPVEDFHTPPAAGGQTATVSGTVRDEDGVAQSGVYVAFGGHDTGLGPDLSAQTAGDGRYQIAGVPVGSYPSLLARPAAPGLEEARRRNVAVAAGGTTAEFTLVRDWASPATARVLSPITSPQDACPPANAIDDDPGSVWSVATPPAGGARELTIDLGATIDIGEIRIDPTAGCGDDASSSVGEFELQVSNDPNTGFVPVFSGRFEPQDLGHATSIPLGGDRPAQRYVRLRILSPLSRDGSGAHYVDVAELEVHRAAGLAAPAVATSSAASVVADAAHLEGQINPGGAGASYFFEYGQTTDYGATTPPRDAGGGTSTVNVSDIVDGLDPASTYHYRIWGLRGQQASVGEDRTFTTPAAKPFAVLFAADAISRTGARLRGAMLPRNSATSYHFDYGKTAAYGQSTPAHSASGTDPVAAAETIGGLEPDTTYSYRLVTSNAGGTTQTAEGRFRTASALPVVVTNAATGVGFTGATLNGSINPNSVATSYRFEYAGGRATATQDAGAGETAKTVSARVDGLEPGRQYSFRLVAFRGAARYEGPELTFTTPARLAPAAATGAAAGVTDTGATLAATIDPHGQATTYHFEYGATAAYGQQTADVNAGSGDGARPVSAAFCDLQPGTTYHYRVVGSNPTGTTAGTDATFTTANAPVVTSPPPVVRPAPPVVSPSRPPATFTGPPALRSRRGSVAIPIAFAPEASVGSGRLELLVSARRIGSSNVAVKPGRSVTATVKLTRAGRNAINRRHRLKATLRLSLPGSAPLTRTVTLR